MQYNRLTLKVESIVAISGIVPVLTRIQENKME